ncbi:SDR family NAD(P)-dependent oxidoreductase [Evansella sp. AB-rgal1]|uniref:SDR family NAD(P)-dependent oxidoreductase n=1 Tax=Evansella sp. AB-rgal1 TaxID=3242696 RepID=UPI00359D57F1
MRALVLGASGGMGYALVKELSSRDVEVVAFSRSQEKLSELFQKDKNVTIHPGDALKMQDILEASENVDIIYHALNVPYPEWSAKLATIMNNVLTAAEKQRAKVAYVDNIYAYGRGQSNKKITEDTPKEPHTKKGKIRLELETLAKQSPAPVVIAHFPDFYGPNADNAMLYYTMKDVIANKKASIVGDPYTAKEVIYTPDGAKALIELSLRDDAYNQNWNIPATDVITGMEFVQKMRDITGYDKQVGTITKRMIKFLGFFNAGMKEVVEMFYLIENPVVLSGAKYEREIGELPKTPYEVGIRETIEFYTNKAKRESTKQLSSTTK